ncbi:MAG: polysaccharide deacetylase family protein [Myxococcales bacterium]
MKEIALVRGKLLRAVADLLPSSIMFQHGPRASRRLALTFDDGPGAHTRELLDVLDGAGVRATFFVIGRACEAYPAELAAIAERGHELAGHGYSHTAFPRLSASELADELSKTSRQLPSGAPRFVRPPRGQVTPRTVLRCRRLGYALAMWSVDPLDWQAGAPEEVVEAVGRSPLRGGDIVLLHEERPHTRAALPELVRRLRLAGFELGTVTEVLRAPHP